MEGITLNKYPSLHYKNNRCHVCIPASMKTVLEDDVRCTLKQLLSKTYYPKMKSANWNNFCNLLAHMFPSTC
jgi:hypothetical protein